MSRVLGTVAGRTPELRRLAGGPVRPLAGCAVAVLVVALPWLGLDLLWQRELILIALLALVVSGLNLTMGFAGELALGQVAMYAAGSYIAGSLATHDITDITVILLASVAGAVVVGLAAGVVGLRLHGWPLGLVSLLLVGLIPNVVTMTGTALGGFQGMAGIPYPTFGGSEIRGTSYYVLVMVCTVVWFAVFRNIVHSREGTSFLVLKESAALASMLGVSAKRTKLRAYTIGAVPAGIAGALYAFLDGYISPGSFSFNLALLVLAASILGGAQSVYGAVLGAALLQLGSDRIPLFEDHPGIVHGLLLLVGGLLLPMGFAGLGRQMLRRSQAARAREAGVSVASGASLPPGGLGGRPVTIDSVEMRFGGFAALGGVSFRAEPGAITALIGPNGSGKTTLLNVVSGLLVPTGGQVTVGDSVVSGGGVKSARSGVTRTFQSPQIPESMSVREVAISGRLAGRSPSLAQTALRGPGHLRRRREDRRFADQALEVVGLSHLAEAPASTLSLGPRRLLELARAIAAEPSVLLLDEIASGLDESELSELGRLVEGARDLGITVVLVEHNFDFVRAVSDHVVVLADGVVLASGTPDEIVADDEVVTRYLGTDRPGCEPSRIEGKA